MCAVPNMAVFRVSLTSCFLGIFLAYFLNDFERVPIDPIIIIIIIIIISEPNKTGKFQELISIISESN